LRIGIFADFHCGHSGVGSWHNRLLFDRAEEVARRTVELLNNQSLDMVVILGDVTNNGTEKQLKLAEKILSKLTMPWFIHPGNHDREGVRNGLFDKIFGCHEPGLYSETVGFPCLFLREYLPREEYPKTELGEEIIHEAVEWTGSRTIERLFIFSHFPLISQQDYAIRHQGQYAKHYLDGEVLLRQLSRLVPGRIICFSAHQHWHRIIDGGQIFHCMTASLIEYPMEARVVSIEDKTLTITTLETACPDSSALSLDSAGWVCGRDSDRTRRIEL